MILDSFIKIENHMYIPKICYLKMLRIDEQMDMIFHGVLVQSNHVNALLTFINHVKRQKV